MLDRLIDRTATTLLVLAATLGFALSFLVVADVVGRVVFNSPVKGTPEIVSSSIVIICFLQAAYAIRSGGMIQVDFFVSRLGPAGRSWAGALCALAGVAFFGLVCWGSIDFAAHAWTSNEFEGEGALRVPAWPARFVVVLGSGLAALCYLLALVTHVRDALAGREPTTATGQSH